MGWQKEQEANASATHRVAKFFPLPARCQLFFAGVALMENFDVKTRETHSRWQPRYSMPLRNR